MDVQAWFPADGQAAELVAQGDGLFDDIAGDCPGIDPGLFSPPRFAPTARSPAKLMDSEPGLPAWLPARTEGAGWANPAEMPCRYLVADGEPGGGAGA